MPPYCCVTIVWEPLLLFCFSITAIQEFVSLMEEKNHSSCRGVQSMIWLTAISKEEIVASVIWRATTAVLRKGAFVEEES